MINNTFTHLVRNSMDHGLETSHQRQVASKPEKGQILTSAEVKNGKLCIRFCDDGNGLNLKKIKQRAVDKNLMNENENNPSKIASIIFEPGFSTSNTVSDISGRGVGMSAVKTYVEECSGSIDFNLGRAEGDCYPITFILTLPQDCFQEKDKLVEQ